MSVVKLLSRIVAPTELDLDSCKDNTSSNKNRKGSTTTTSLHDHTYGITSDPLTQFTCAFSALVHDVDHQGIPNTRLSEEDPKLSELYEHRSIAEQNSLSIAWNLLMEPRFEDFRRCLYTTESELERFRSLLVNCVMATDLVDKELKALRNGRWDKAFHPEKLTECVEQHTTNAKDDTNRKATIVIEHLIQASDIAHTMQHWHVYRKWNQRLFNELYKAFLDGRSTSNPADFWATGEIGFFDFYIIPLAKKLKECGVFGISSDEYLNYALANRAEWSSKGEEIVKDMLEEYHSAKDGKKKEGRKTNKRFNNMKDIPEAAPSSSRTLSDQ